MLRCRLCDQPHRSVALGAGERALCRRCGTLLAKRSRWGRDAALAFTLAGLILAVPAALLPFVIVDKFGQDRVAYLFTASDALWERGARLLAVWVMLCGVISPMLLLGTLAALLLPAKFRRPIERHHALWRFAHAIEHWAMPEVYVLAVLVALTKLGTLVNVSVGPGFWCYLGLTLMSVFAWSTFEFGWPGAARERPPARIVSRVP